MLFAPPHALSRAAPACQGWHYVPHACQPRVGRWGQRLLITQAHRIASGAPPRGPDRRTVSDASCMAASLTQPLYSPRHTPCQPHHIPRLCGSTWQPYMRSYHTSIVGHTRFDTGVKYLNTGVKTFNNGVKMLFAPPHALSRAAPACQGWHYVPHACQARVGRWGQR